MFCIILHKTLFHHARVQKERKEQKMKVHYTYTLVGLFFFRSANEVVGSHEFQFLLNGKSFHIRVTSVGYHGIRHIWEGIVMACLFVQ